jgi:hypothetical protein
MTIFQSTSSLDDNVTRMTDIHDIKPVLEMGPDLTWLYWAAGILVILAMAWQGWRVWKKRAKGLSSIPTPPPIAPDVEAYNALDALAADEGVVPKQFYFRLSAIVRRYIERRYAIPAAEMTSEELLPRVDRLPLAPDLTQLLKEFCRKADPIKFAGAAAPPDRLPGDLAFAREFVRRTAPDEPSAEKTTAVAPPATKQLTTSTT